MSAECPIEERKQRESVGNRMQKGERGTKSDICLCLCYCGLFGVTARLLSVSDHIGKDTQYIDQKLSVSLSVPLVEWVKG